MAVAVTVTNAWATPKSAIPMSQFRPSNYSCLDFSSIAAKPSSNLSLFLAAPNHPLRLKDSLLLCRCNTDDDASTGNSSSHWDWIRWNRHFSQVEKAERFFSILKFQLEEAIKNEDFEEAEKLKAALAESTSNDCVAEIMSELKNAIDDERYHDASKLCRNTGSGLVGWWVGNSKDPDDPFGRIVRITPGVGRFIARIYKPRQLASATLGTPLFEIFVVKDTDATYNKQVVYLQRGKMSIAKSATPVSSISPKGPSAAEVKNASVIDVQIGKDKVQNDEAITKSDGVTKERRSVIDKIRGITELLRDKLHELKLENLKVMKINSIEDIIKDINQFIEEIDESTLSGEGSEDENSDLDHSDSDQVYLEASSDTNKEGKDPKVKLFIGGVVRNKEDIPLKDEYIRVPAEIEEIERDSFILHVPTRIRDHVTEETIASEANINYTAAQCLSDLIPATASEEFAKAMQSVRNSDKVSLKISKNVREIIEFAINQAIKGEKVSEFTNFSRISTSRGDLDPFDGLFIGVFGPVYGTEVVQLRRKYGNWGRNGEFFEYVEAVKLTGDLNIPAGQVTFRARVEKEKHYSSRDKKLGVVARHSGQGRIADFGFKNPKWVDGILLVLDGKGMESYGKGTKLAFLHRNPDPGFLELFHRVKLPE